MVLVASNKSKRAGDAARGAAVDAAGGGARPSSVYVVRETSHKAADMPFVVFIGNADVCACRMPDLAEDVRAMLEARGPGAGRGSSKAAKRESSKSEREGAGGAR